MEQNNVHTEEYYIASIDLLGAKELILSDRDDLYLNQIKNIYTSWVRIKGESYYSNLKLKIFSDNVIIAIQSECRDAADNLLEFVVYMADHFLRCGYKPRGGICKGNLYIDDMFVWGEGLVLAYLMESKEAVYPRIIIDNNVVSGTTQHLKEWMIFEDTDGKCCLNYLKPFGESKSYRINKIKEVAERNYEEIENLKTRCMLEQNREKRQNIEKVIAKLEWLRKYLDDNKDI